MSLNDKLKVSALPLAIVDGEKTANLELVENYMSQLPEGTDLVVLPELFSTGYIPHSEAAESLAEGNDGPTIQLLKELAAKHKVAISGTFIAHNGHKDEKETKVYNRAFFIEPSGEATYYDKRHLFVLGEESKIFTAGDRLPKVVRYRGWNLMMSICYDVRFPVWLRNTKNKYDALIIPANWPDKRGLAWEKLLQARAIENIAYVIGANRSGKDEFGGYDGMTFTYDYFGREISSDYGPFVVSELNRPILKEVREHFPAWRDADDFKIIL